MPMNPYAKYQQQSVMTMTQGEMLVKLYDEILKQLNGAVAYLAENDYGKANQALQKAQRIVSHLRATLNFKYDISRNLDSLYDYFNRKLVDANISKNPAPINEVIPMIGELKDSFAQAERLARIQ